MEEKLKQVVESLRARLTPDFVEAQVRQLLRQGEDVGGGVNAFRLIKHLLGGVAGSDEQVTWAYGQLKPALGAALAQIPSLYYFEGD
ncbi:MAG TPA: hypothetical protein VM366_03095 [Anaerolineae bacterium]|nr:hypothetical protein [Anaerolineae bacterium]